MLLLILIHLIILVIYPDDDSGECRTQLHQDERQWMSTKQGYRHIASKLTDHDEDDGECRAVHLWTVVRHGTRYPSRDAITLMTEDLPQLRDKILRQNNSSLCNQDLELIKNWKVNIESDWSKTLHKEGEEEMVLLGRRWLNRFPHLLDQYDPELFHLRSTDTQRSMRSGQSFVSGLWSRDVLPETDWHVVTSGHDPLIRFYKTCDAWIKQVKKNKAANKEKELFEKSETMRSVERSVSSVLGLDISMTDLDMMYMMCNFDLAWSSSPSPWCRVFSDHDLQVMEYREDLEYYWIDGPGYTVTREAACVLVKDVVTKFRNIVSDGDRSKGSFYFTHSGTILKLLAYLNIFNDKESLRSDNFAKMNNRLWRTSYIGPFGANIAFVLKSCSEGDHTVGLYINEQLTLVPGCDHLWCPLSHFLQLYPDIDDCDLNKICQDDSVEDTIPVPDDKY